MTYETAPLAKSELLILREKLDELKDANDLRTLSFARLEVTVSTTAQGLLEEMSKIHQALKEMTFLTIEIESLRAQIAEGIEEHLACIKNESLLQEAIHEIEEQLKVISSLKKKASTNRILIITNISALFLLSLAVIVHIFLGG